MIVNDSGDFSGSVSGGCVEGEVVRQCLDLIKDKKNLKKSISKYLMKVRGMLD